MKITREGLIGGPGSSLVDLGACDAPADTNDQPYMRAMWFLLPATFNLDER